MFLIDEKSEVWLQPLNHRSLITGYSCFDSTYLVKASSTLHIHLRHQGSKYNYPAAKGPQARQEVAS